MCSETRQLESIKYSGPYRRQVNHSCTHTRKALTVSLKVTNKSRSKMNSHWAFVFAFAFIGEVDWAGPQCQFSFPANEAKAARMSFTFPSYGHSVQKVWWRRPHLKKKKSTMTSCALPGQAPPPVMPLTRAGNVGSGTQSGAWSGSSVGGTRPVRTVPPWLL